jgi:KDO2-lipid IV(A) lauroyltransferase
MGKRKKGKRSDFLVYILVMVILFVLRIIPKSLSRAFCIGLGKLAYKLDKKHRELSVNNLKMAFPEKSDDEILDISRKVFENLGATLYDMAIMPKINERNYKKYFEFEGEEHLREALNRGKGILLISGHLCNWEMLSAHCLNSDWTSVLAKDIHNEYFNGYIKRARKNKKTHFLPVRSSVGKVIKILRAGETVTTLIDQHAHAHEAVMVDFFGRKASTGKFMALLSIKLDITILPMFVKRVGKYKYKHYYLEPVKITKTGDRQKDILDNTQTLTKVVEDEIRKRPEDWLWVHNRWKQT